MVIGPPAKLTNVELLVDIDVTGPGHVTVGGYLIAAGQRAPASTAEAETVTGNAK